MICYDKSFEQKLSSISLNPKFAIQIFMGFEGMR